MESLKSDLNQDVHRTIELMRCIKLERITIEDGNSTTIIKQKEDLAKGRASIKLMRKQKRLVLSIMQDMEKVQKVLPTCLPICDQVTPCETMGKKECDLITGAADYASVFLQNGPSIGRQLSIPDARVILRNMIATCKYCKYQVDSLTAYAMSNYVEYWFKKYLNRWRRAYFPEEDPDT